jgi:hypothetical protein
MKTGGIVVCSTLVALVYISKYSYGRSVTGKPIERFAFSYLLPALGVAQKEGLALLTK